MPGQKTMTQTGSTPGPAPVSQLVLRGVIDGLSFDQLKAVHAKALLALFELGDEETAVDLELVARLDALASRGPIVINGRAVECTALSEADAARLLHRLEAWLKDLEAACDAAWAHAQVPYNRGIYRKPLVLLRSILSDLKSGNNKTIWTRLSPRRRGQRPDDTYTKALKERAAQTVLFLTDNGYKNKAACDHVANFVIATGARLGNRPSPLPSSGRIMRLRKDVEPLPMQLTIAASRLLNADRSESADRSKQAEAVVAVLMGELVQSCFTVPRATKVESRSGHPRRKK